MSLTTHTHEFDTTTPAVVSLGSEATARALDSLDTVDHHRPPDVDAALALIGQVDCVVTERRLPGDRDGLDVFDAVRRRSAHVPVVVVTDDTTAASDGVVTDDTTAASVTDDTESFVREAFRRGVTGHVARGDDAAYAEALATRVEVAVEHARDERERARSRAAVDARPVPVVAVSPDGRVRYANPAYCDLFDRRESTLVGEPLSAVHPEGDTERLRRAAAATADGDEWAGTVVGLRGDGSPVRVRAVVSPLPDGGFTTVVTPTDAGVSLGDAPRR